MFDFDIELKDRIEVIKTVNLKYDLISNAYISFSGGKDSTVLHYLFDMALPKNKIPRVFCNTGMEYLETIKFVTEFKKSDERFYVVSSIQKPKVILSMYGYPFKSKEYSELLKIGGSSSYYKLLSRNYDEVFLKYFFEHKIKISDECCKKMKIQPLEDYSHYHHKSIAITGLMASEGGRRARINNCLTISGNELIKFHPLLKLDSDFINEFIKKFDIKLSALYSDPYNFLRTGCRGCPFNIFLKNDLEILKKYSPIDYKMAVETFGPVYDEYRRLKFRL